LPGVLLGEPPASASTGGSMLRVVAIVTQLTESAEIRALAVLRRVIQMRHSKHDPRAGLRVARAIPDAAELAAIPGVGSDLARDPSPILRVARALL